MQEYIIDKYRFFYLSGLESYEAKISLFNAGKLVAKVFFINDKQSVTANSLHELPFSIYFPLSRFDDVIKIFRFEKPVSLYVHEDKKAVEIGTGRFTEENAKA
jgi:hypothetical protein